MESKKQQKNNSKNELYKKIKEILKTPRGKAIVFLVFYFFFFVFVISALGNDTTTNTTKKALDVDLFLLEENNYHFYYQDTLGNITTIYEGDRNSNVSLFTKIVGNEISSYFSKDSVYLKKDLISNQYVMVDNPYIYSELKQIDNIKMMLEKATYLSTNSNKQTYQISTTTLISLFENKEVDLDDIPNTIILTLNEDNQVYKIDYSFNSYSIYKGYGTYQSSMEYSNFSSIGEIEIPS